MQVGFGWGKLSLPCCPLGGESKHNRMDVKTLTCRIVVPPGLLLGMVLEHPPLFFNPPLGCLFFPPLHINPFKPDPYKPDNAEID